MGCTGNVVPLAGPAIQSRALGVGLGAFFRLARQKITPLVVLLLCSFLIVVRRICIQFVVVAYHRTLWVYTLFVLEIDLLPSVSLTVQDPLLLLELAPELALGRALFSDFDVDEVMHNSSGWFNVMLYLLYLFIAVFVMLSLFLSLLAEGFIKIKTERDKERADDPHYSEFGLLYSGLRSITWTINKTAEIYGGNTAVQLLAALVVGEDGTDDSQLVGNDAWRKKNERLAAKARKEAAAERLGADVRSLGDAVDQLTAALQDLRGEQAAKQQQQPEQLQQSRTESAATAGGDAGAGTGVRFATDGPMSPGQGAMKRSNTSKKLGRFAAAFGGGRPSAATPATDGEARAPSQPAGGADGAARDAGPGGDSDGAQPNSSVGKAAPPAAPAGGVGVPKKKHGRRGLYTEPPEPEVVKKERPPVIKFERPLQDAVTKAIMEDAARQAEMAEARRVREEALAAERRAYAEEMAKLTEMVSDLEAKHDATIDEMLRRLTEAAERKAPYKPMGEAERSMLMERALEERLNEREEASAAKKAGTVPLTAEQKAQKEAEADAKPLAVDATGRVTNGHGKVVGVANAAGQVVDPNGNLVGLVDSGSGRVIDVYGRVVRSPMKSAARSADQRYRHFHSWEDAEVEWIAKRQALDAGALDMWAAPTAGAPSPLRSRRGSASRSRRHMHGSPGGGHDDDEDEVLRRVAQQIGRSPPRSPPKALLPPMPPRPPRPSRATPQPPAAYSRDRPRHQLRRLRQDEVHLHEQQVEQRSPYQFSPAMTRWPEQWERPPRWSAPALSPRQAASVAAIEWEVSAAQRELDAAAEEEAAAADGVGTLE